MVRLKRFLQLPPRERRLLIQAATLLALVRAGLWVLPFKLVLESARRVRQPARTDVGIPVASIIRAVRRAGRTIPAATCLTQALVGHILLARAGHASELRIGVRKDPARGFQAHAWLEHGGEVVLGDLQDLSRYAPMLPAGQRS